METAKQSRLLRRVVVPFAVIGWLVFSGWALVTAFNFGAATATAGAVGTLLVYQAPAVVFDWPRVTLDDIGDFFTGILDWLTALFDW